MRVPDTDPKSPRLLVVDDEPQIREILAAALRREGYRVAVHEDGRAALEEIERGGEVSVLLTDLKMPRMNGLDLIREAKRIRPNLGSIVLTAYSSTETAVQAMRCGADDFLAKPFGLDDVRRVVGRVIETRRLLGEGPVEIAKAWEEAETQKQRSLRAEVALESARRDLDLSRQDLERRILDLEFVSELTSLLAREDDVERVLQTTVRILAVRFHARFARIEVALPHGVRTAEHQTGPVPHGVFATMMPDLLERARGSADGVLRDVVLGFGAPLEGLAAAVDLASGPAGGMALLRPPSEATQTEDMFLLGLVGRALAVALDAHMNRHAAVESALRVATGILDALEGRGTFHRGHAERVERLSVRIAERMGLSPRLVRVIQTAARLHDVGEIGVPDAILQHPGRLDEAQVLVVRSHSAIGARILAPFGEAAAFVRHHHERPDGTGYPDGLPAAEIPLGAGIISLAEAYDAMTHSRPYRPSRSRKETLAEIERLKGEQFLAEPAEVLLNLSGEES